MSPARKDAESQADFVNIAREAASLAGVPVLIAVDQELGGIQRLHQLVPAVASREQLKDLSSQDIEQRCFVMANVARGLGVNLFLAPIVDVVTGATHGYTTGIWAPTPLKSVGCPVPISAGFNALASLQLLNTFPVTTSPSRTRQ